jgi:hypothetical protein
MTRVGSQRHRTKNNEIKLFVSMDKNLKAQVMIQLCGVFEGRNEHTDWIRDHRLPIHSFL